ncbi:peptidyl-prolyl cis-trans isomerase NIMA-interacting 1-like [Convolutriloba macropyga]|uniref:peptidyl-prolyl cis-trans isomerase NIMA-interacting 1-like n=1 Tax=Convolutriloba macropyga TaxID=536237 RepID=UPI003F5231CE
MPEQVQCLHLLVKHTGSRNPTSWKSPQITRSKEEAIEILKGFHSQLKPLSGNELVKAFGGLAATNSDCSSAKRGGDLGLFKRGQMQKPFEDASFSLQVFELSGIVDTDSGVHIILRVQ